MWMTIQIMLSEMTVTPKRQKSIQFRSKHEWYLNIKDQNTTFLARMNRYHPELNNNLRKQQGFFFFLTSLLKKRKLCVCYLTTNTFGSRIVQNLGKKCGKVTRKLCLFICRNILVPNGIVYHGPENCDIVLQKEKKYLCIYIGKLLQKTYTCQEHMTARGEIPFRMLSVILLHMLIFLGFLLT